VLVALAIGFSGSGSAPFMPAGGNVEPDSVAAREFPAIPAPASRCRSARLAVSHYRALTYDRQAARYGRRATLSPIVRGKACSWARYAAATWVARARSARLRLEAWREHHFDWRSWLPANWYALGSCETGYGGDPNWEHSNGRFTSAFGISWAEYDADAAYMGAPPWHVRHTPRDQYDAALGHLARFGDGWSCPGP
jgi:hypothetical protein